MRIPLVLFILRPLTSLLYQKQTRYLGSRVQTDLFILNQVGSTTQQIRIANLGYNQVENAQSQIERAKSNELWRLKRIQRYWVEIHKKFPIPFACIIFVLLGAPIGILTRKGNVEYAAIIASILLTVYWYR